MSSASPGKQHCDCEYEHVKKILESSRGCLRDLLREIWKVVYHKNDSAIHELEKSLYRSLVQEKKPHTHDMQTKPLAEWTDREIFCGLYTRKVQKYLLNATPRSYRTYPKRHSYEQQKDNKKKYSMLLETRVVTRKCFERGVVKYFEEAHNQVYYAVQTLRTIGHILEHLVYAEQQGHVGQAAQVLLQKLIHDAKFMILSACLGLKKQHKQNYTGGHQNVSVVDNNKDSHEGHGNISVVGNNKDSHNTAEHKISDWIVAQMATRNKVPKNTHITHMDASTSEQAIVFRRVFKYVNVVEQNTGSAGELFQSIKKGTPGAMPLNFNTFSSNSHNNLCNLSQGVVFSDGMAKKKRHSKNKAVGTHSTLVNGFRTIIKSMCKQTPKGTKPGNKPVLLVLKILNADGLSRVTDDNPEHTTRFENFALSSKMVDHTGHDFFLASVWTVPGSTVCDANQSYNEYFNTQTAAIGPLPPQTSKSSAERSKDPPEPFELYFNSPTHSMDSLAVRSRGPKSTNTNASRTSPDPNYPPTTPDTSLGSPSYVPSSRAIQTRKNSLETKMEAEYDLGVSQNRLIVEGIKSAYIEITFYQSIDLQKVVQQCVSDVYDNLLTYASSVWEEDTTSNGDIYRLALYVVWNSHPLTTPTQVTGTKPHNMHMPHVRTPGEIFTYLLQILPRETHVLAFMEIICSPSNVMNTIMYCRGYVPGKIEPNATSETDISRRIRRGVLKTGDNAAMYVEYGKHPLGLTDVSKGKHNVSDYMYRYTLGPVGVQTDSRYDLRTFMNPAGVEFKNPTHLSNIDAVGESACFQITFSAFMQPTIDIFKRAFELGHLVYLKHAMVKGVVNPDEHYVLMFGIAQPKIHRNKIISALPGAENRTDVICIMQIGHDDYVQASADFEKVVAHATVAPNCFWETMGTIDAAVEPLNTGTKRGKTGTDVFGGNEKRKADITNVSNFRQMQRVSESSDEKPVATSSQKAIGPLLAPSQPQASKSPPMMEVEYEKGVLQDPAIVQGIKSAYIEILCYKSSKIANVIDECVSHVFENLLTYTVSVWKADTTKQNILRLELYVVWDGLAHPIPGQVAETNHEPDDTHKQYVRTPGEILTYLMQILPRETSLNSCHEIICSPANIMNAIIYARGYVPGKPDGLDKSRPIRRGVLMNRDNAALYTEYGQHPLGLTDVNIPKHKGSEYTPGPVGLQTDVVCDLSKFMEEAPVNVIDPITLSKLEPVIESACFQITFDFKIQATIELFEKAYTAGDLVYLKFAVLEGAVDPDEHYVLMFGIANPKISHGMIISELPEAGNRSDVKCIMKIGRDDCVQANADFEQISAQKTLALNSSWKTSGNIESAVKALNMGNKRSTDTSVFGGEVRIAKHRKN